ncbi:MAG: hypothetical protein GMKNLPBB_00352 [Myxococcota bacterium]|nr:hypothetical protein [Myxococcota bacterium]
MFSPQKSGGQYIEAGPGVKKHTGCGVESQERRLSGSQWTRAGATAMQADSANPLNDTARTYARSSR